VPRALLGLGLLGGAAGLGVLLAFHQVMLRSVEQGELRRRATATHWQATWRCNALRDLGQAQACLAQLRVAPPDAQIDVQPPQVGGVFVTAQSRVAP
jgi:hypothetical protein